MGAATVQVRLRARPLVTGALSVAVAISGQGFVAGHEFVYDGLFLYVVALVLGALALELPPESVGAPKPDGASIPTLTIDRPVIVAGGFALAANLLALRLFATNSSPSAAWVLYGASVVATPLAVWLAGGRRRPHPFRGWELNEVAALGLVLLVAAGFRLFRIDSLPFGLWWDEAFSGLQVLRIMNDPGYRPVYVAGMAQEPALFWYLVIPFFQLLGPGPLGLRATAVVGGLLGVVAVFLLARELAGRRVAIVAAFLLAVMAWDVNFSRIAFNCIWSVALDALACYFLLRGMRTGGVGAFAMAGVTLGVAANMYYTTRLVPVVVLPFLLHRLVAERGAFLKRYSGGLLLMVAATLIAVSPLLQFAYLHTADFLSRADQVTVWRAVNDQHSLTPVIDSLRQHLLMFLYQGDRNGRHNLSGAPMLDQVTGALFVLGLVMALRRFRQGSYFFLLVWVVVMLAGGVLSLGFEAPQSLRTIDEVTAVAILAALPVAALWERLAEFSWGELRMVFGQGGAAQRQVAVSAVTLPVVGLLLVVAGMNYDRYFNQQANSYDSWSAFSTAETIIGNRVKQLGDGYNVYLGQTLTGHPTIEFLGGRGNLPAFAPADQLPLPESKGAAIFLEPSQSQVVAVLRQLYPQAEVQSYRPPFSDRVILYSVVIPPSQVAAIHGLTASFYPNTEGAGTPRATERLRYPATDWQEPGLPQMPFFVKWEGILSAPDYGPYRFKLEGAGGLDLFLDGRRLAGVGEGQRMELARGTHTLQVTGVVNQPVTTRLLWQPPKAAQLSLIPGERLFSSPASNHGLQGAYYHNRDWAGPPAFQRIDPVMEMRFHLLPLPRPYSVEWRGKVDVPRTGTYRFATDSADASWVYLDENLVATNEGAIRQLREGSVSLGAGLHDLRVRYRDDTSYTYFQLYWTPPDGEREPIPYDRLYPVMDSYPPPLELPLMSTPSAQSRAPATLPVGSVKVEFGRSMGDGALTDPRDVSAAPDGRVYVADGAGKRVIVMNPDGSLAGQLPGEFVQPFGVMVSADGKVAVLDSLGKDPILLFGPRGEPLGRFGGGSGSYSPRGLFVDGTGAYYLADTGRGRVLKLSPTGQVVGEYRGGGQLAQPVSVAVDRNGILYVIDGEKHQLLVLGSDDGIQRSWSIPVSTTMDAPHVALGPKGEIYVSDPNGGAVAIYDAQGNGIGRVGTVGSGAGQFNLPTGLQVDDQGRLWVADTRNKRVEQWTVR